MRIILFIFCLFSFPCISFAGESSILVDENTQVPKEHWFQKSMFVHETYFINPFSQYQIIVEKNGDDILRYRVWWKIFNENHFLYIGTNDSEIKKTMYWWIEHTPGIYKKQILQEATYTRENGVVTPNQSVAATTYYKVIYNHDSTAPICANHEFSHDSSWQQNFLLPENSWFNEEKYAYFRCEDEESWCNCPAWDASCFVKNNSVFSMPEILEHNSTFNWEIKNTVWMSTQCNSWNETKIFYDRNTPDMDLYVNNIRIDTDTSREYVSNDGILYDGQQIPEKRFYNIMNPISLKADTDTKMRIELSDLYDSAALEQWVSGIQKYTISVSKNQSWLWSQLWKINVNFDPFNPEWTRQENDTQVIIWEDISFLKNTFTKSWEYQVFINFTDFAGNNTRVIYHYTIVPNRVDAVTSLIETTQRNTLYADNESYYTYNISLRDEHGNPISGKQIYNLEHSCEWISGCYVPMQNRLWDQLSWDRAIEIFDQNLVSDDMWNISFKLRSFAPWPLTDSFIFEIFDWDNEYETLFSSRYGTHIYSWENSFLHLFGWKLESYVDTQWWNEIPIWDETLYRLQVLEYTDSMFDGEIWDFSSFIQSQDPDSNFSLTWSLDQISNQEIQFSGTMNTSLNSNEYNKIGIEISENNISATQISYVISGKRVRHYLSGVQSSQSPISMNKNVWVLTNPVKIIWNLQWVWNTRNSNERQNISEISSSKMRNSIRKNIWKSIRWRIHDTTVDGVKYIDATQLTDNRYILESNPNFETLVVHNGNIHINSDFTPAWNLRWIISYIDWWYSDNNWYSSIWNIYIDSDVSQIHAAMYSDGALVSTRNNIPLDGNISSRSSHLQNQLYLKGVLFTRNTLAWATLQGWNYILPWWDTTTNQILAIQYDLYHIRRGANNCISVNASCPYSEYLIIEYDPRITSEPPPFFQSQ